MNAISHTSGPTWLEEAIGYQIYPQTFSDSNGDGIGDIPGINGKLDYLQSLSITTCWLSPCFVSPFQDAGFDVSGYYKIAPCYGTKESGNSRTRALTPMQWSGEVNAGFSTAVPGQLYLPIDPSPDRLTIESQELDPDSLVNHVRRFVAIRKNHPVHQASAPFEVLFAQPGVYPLVFQRSASDGTFIVAINPSAQSVHAELPINATSLPHTIYGPGEVLSLKICSLKTHLPGISEGIYHLP